MLTRFSTVVRRVIARLRRDRLDDELREEIEGHIELRRQQLIEDGADPSRAGQDARRAFGNVTRCANTRGRCGRCRRWTRSARTFATACA